MNAADLRNIAAEARPVIARMLDDAEVLAGLGKVCREQGVDWAQLKALIKAQIRDDRDDEGDGGHVEAIINRADAASAYADLLANMNNKNFSSRPEPAPVTQPSPPVVQPTPIRPAVAPDEFRAAAAVEAQHLDLTERDDCPAFLDRRAG